MPAIFAFLRDHARLKSACHITSPVATPALALLLLLASASAVQQAQLRLRLLETNDLHMNPLSYDYYQDKVTDQYGLFRAASLIKAARAESPNSLLIDNVDLVQGNPVGDFVAKVKPITKTANFVVATNNYRAFGGGNFLDLKADKVIFEAPDETRPALPAQPAQYQTGERQRWRLGVV